VGFEVRPKDVGEDSAVEKIVDAKNYEIYT
jgi:hypothetical protein